MHATIQLKMMASDQSAKTLSLSLSLSLTHTHTHTHSLSLSQHVYTHHLYESRIGVRSGGHQGLLFASEVLDEKKLEPRHRARSDYVCGKAAFAHVVKYDLVGLVDVLTLVEST
jgi:hypothetical protein